MKIINKLNDIDDKHVNEAIKIDNKKKLMEEKMKENNKKSIWKYIFVPVTCVCAVVMAIIYVNNNKNENKIVRTNNKYLTANYSMLLYSEADSYIKENINLSELDENKSITIDSNKILKNVSEEYKYCSGEVIITKNKFGMYEHTVKSSCDNESKENINLTLKVYTNVNQNSEYQILSNVTEKEDGYIGVLSNYIINSSDNIVTTKYDGVSGVVKLDKDLNITDLKLLDKPVTSMSTNIYSLKDNYIITNYPDGVNGKQVVSYYDSNLKLLWSKSYENYTLTNYLTETNDKVLFGEFNKVIYINKKDGSFDSSIEIGSIGNVTLSYKDGYLFLFDYFKTYKLYKYDLDGKELLAIDLLNVDGINKDANVVSQKQGNNVSIFRSNNNLYVFDKDGKLINTIDISNDDLYDFNVLNDTYEIIYNISGETYKVLEDGNEKIVQGKVKKYVKYDLSNNIIISTNIDNTYGYDMLENVGLSVSNMAHNTYVLNNELFEYMYSKDNNGTLVLMVYDYSKVNDTDDENSDNNSNDKSTINEGENNQ